MSQGIPEVVPSDGLTTRQRREQAILAVNTGDGKGKSTAAFGMALRSWSAGSSIAVFQFVKSAKWKVGEATALTHLGELHAADPSVGGPVEWHTMGSGWSWTRANRTEASREQRAADAAEGWAEISRRLAAERHDFYVLDEFTYPMEWGWVDVEEVAQTLLARPGRQHVVITGRRAPQRIIQIADLVTEMRKVKHPFDAGRKGQRGIEW